MDNKKLKLVATDLDGTFLKNDKSISTENLDALHLLGQKGIIRVIATGRNLHKTNEVISPEIPFDYIVFSSGAGILDCKSKQLIYSRNLDKEIVNNISKFLIDNDLNFHLFKAVPENYKCWYYRGSKPCDEFERYFDFHHSFSEVLPASDNLNSDACQFLVVFPDNLEKFLMFKEKIESKFENVKVVRTSSPLETGYIWMEIFHESVSKGNGVKFICEKYEIDSKYTLGIGNDYNDLDLLDFTNHSFIVDNGPDEMKKIYNRTKTNEENAFKHSIEIFL